MALRLAWLICTWTVLGKLPSLPFFTFYFFIFIIFLIYIIYFIIFYSLLFFIILLRMDPKCLLTSTDLQTRRARCQHQLSFLFLIVCECCYHLMVNKDVYIQKYQDRTESIQSFGLQERHPACRNSHTQSKKKHYSSGLWETRPNLDWSEEKNCSSSAVASLLIILLGI